jgi:hypothetical protein
LIELGVVCLRVDVIVDLLDTIGEVEGVTFFDDRTALVVDIGAEALIRALFFDVDEDDGVPEEEDDLTPAASRDEIRRLEVVVVILNLLIVGRGKEGERKETNQGF